MSRCDPALGAGTYTPTWVNRATGRAVAFDEGVDANIKFNRTLDSTSSVTVEISPANGCCPRLPTERVDELHLTRDDGSTPWLGPVTRVTDDQEAGKITVQAEDRSYWWQGAPFAQPISHADETVDPVTVFAEVLAQVDKYQPSGLELPASPVPYGLKIGAHYAKGESAWDALDALGQSLVDWTVVGNRLWWGGREVPVADGPTLYKSKHWQSGSLTVDRDATAVVTSVRVAGSNGIVATYPAADVDAGYGRRTLFVTDSNLSTYAEALERARFLYEANRAPSNFMTTGGGTLSGDAPVCLHDLIPGRKFLVVADSGCLAAAELLRLTNVVVEIATGLDCNGRFGFLERSVAVDFARVGTQGTAAKVSN